jgi:hypothetical protein
MANLVKIEIVMQALAHADKKKKDSSFLQKKKQKTFAGSEAHRQSPVLPGRNTG